MPVTVPAPAWGLMLQDAHAVDERRRGYLPLVTEALKTYWSSVLPRGACKVLEWLTARTAGVGAPAAVGTLRQLLQPYTASVGVVVLPLAISINTLRSHLRTLEAKSIVRVYEIDGELTTKQNAPRAFEIDFKVVVLHPYCSEDARRKVLLLGSNAGKGSLFGGPPPKMTAYVRGRACGISYINRHEVPSYSNQRLGKPNHPLSASPTGGWRGETSFARQLESDLKMISFPVPKKARSAAQRPDTVAGVLSSLSSKAQTRSVTTKSKAAAGATDKATMQNYLNELMREFYPKQPRLVVTDKPLSVMKKRLASYGITDYRELLRFALSEWSSIAQKNRQAFTRRLMEGKSGTPMAEYPSFAELAYRLPYFVTIFTSGTYSPAGGEQEQEAQKLRKKVAALEQEIVATRKRLRRAAPKKDTAAPVVRRSTPSADWTPPSWD